MKGNEKKRKKNKKTYFDRTPSLGIPLISRVWPPSYPGIGLALFERASQPFWPRPDVLPLPDPLPLPTLRFYFEF